jgi:hypothetical protein
MSLQKLASSIRDLKNLSYKNPLANIQLEKLKSAKNSIDKNEGLKTDVFSTAKYVKILALNFLVNREHEKNSSRKESLRVVSKFKRVIPLLVPYFDKKDDFI